jgi:hypothetical protein
VSAPGAPPAPPGRRAARAADRRRAREEGGGRSRVVVALATSVALVASAVVAGVQIADGRARAADDARTAEALGLAADLAAAEDDFLAGQRRAGQLDASARVLAARDAREAAAAAEAAEAARAAEAAAAAEAQASADAQAAADARAAQEARAAQQAPRSGSGAPGIAGWVDGRPVDAAGNVLWVTSVPTPDGDGSNGNMPASAMCVIPWGTDQLGFAQYLRCDAADALTALDDAFAAQFGASLDLDLTYRSYADQVAMKAAFGGLAAAPGTSSHGLGTALDVQEWPATYGFGTARYDWLVANGPTYGWYAPARVREGQPYAEYWHIEYGPGRTS